MPVWTFKLKDKWIDQIWGSIHVLTCLFFTVKQYCKQNVASLYKMFVLQEEYTLLYRYNKVAQ